MRLPVLLILLLATFSSGQVQVQGPSKVYEGQNVSSVALIGNPHRDMEPLRPVAVQKAGEPYSQAKVEASIQALQRAGGFPKVTVNVVPDLAGLRVSFLLEPAYFLGMVDFPGAAKTFSYTRLLQIANLPDEDPYDPARITVGEQVLGDFFKHNGYFDSKIESTIQIDDHRQLVNVSYHVKLGKQARIAGVEIQGTDSAEAARLLHSTRTVRARLTGGLLKPGKPYTAARLNAALTLIRRTLSQQNRLANKVEENPPQFHPENNRVDISFKVQLGPVINVRTTGAKLTILPFLAGRQMKKLIPIYSERSIDRELVEEGQQGLVDYFQKKGYFDVAVKINVTRQPDQVSLVYEIKIGRAHV